MKVPTLKRLGAYLIDFLIINLFISLLFVFIPYGKEYDSNYEKYTSLTELYKDGKISADSYINESKPIVYNIEKSMAVNTIINFIIVVAYFGTYAYYKNGQTIGKRYMKIKIEKINKGKNDHLNYIIRSMIFGGSIFSILTTVCLLFGKNNFIYFESIISAISLLYQTVNIFFMLCRKDGRGLHDLICNTKVVKD